MKPRILFILKYRDSYDPYDYNPCNPTTKPEDHKTLSSGLFNSATFVVEMLRLEGYEVKLVQVVDNNGIDREVHQYKPTHVVIEALWVVPDKFHILQKLHPHVQWIVRGHSEMPFLAQEGVAVDWLCEYVHHKNVSIAANSLRSTEDLRWIIKAANPEWSHEKVHEKVLLLPNWYPHHNRYSPIKKEVEDEKYIDVACFGAIRPLKNQLIQALAAIEFADIKGKILRFHINATRCEQKGGNVLRNLEALFNNLEHQLVKHPWMEHDEFLHLLRKMDVGMQVSFSETFNIVAADMVVTGLPIVVSPEVSWVSTWCQAEATSSEDILMKLFKVTDWRLKMAIRVMNVRGLRFYCDESLKCWEYVLKEK